MVASKYKFVIDESIAYYAISGINPSGGPVDVPSYTILQEIVNRCHNIVVDCELARRYYDMLHGCKNSERVNFFKTIIINPDKFDRRYDPLPAPTKGRATFEKDMYLVKIAESCNAIIVTSHPQNFTAVKALTPKDALKLINQ